MSLVSMTFTLESLKDHLIERAKAAGLNPPSDKTNIYLMYDIPAYPQPFGGSYLPSGIKICWNVR